MTNKPAHEVIHDLALRNVTVGEVRDLLAAIRRYQQAGDDETRAFHATRGHFPDIDADLIEKVVRHEYGILGGKPVGQRKVGEREAHKKKLVVLRGNRMKPRRVEPLWPGMVYYGEATLFFGMPKIGKSTAVNDIAARVSSGAPMPGEPVGVNRAARSVVILTAEDDPETVIWPQLKAAGALMNNVFIVPSAELDQANASFDLATDLGLVESVIQRQDLTQSTTESDPVGLVVISPITAYLGKSADANSATAVRAVLDPFIAMLRRNRVACLLIGHPRKGAGDEIAMYQNAGSVAFVAAPRVVAMAMRDPARNEDGSEKPRLLLRSANNLEPDAPFGFAYRLVSKKVNFGSDGVFDVAGIEWVGRADRDPDQVLEVAKEMKAASKTEESKMERAKRLLLRELASGPRNPTWLKAKAAEEGISAVTLDRAKPLVGAESGRDPNFGGHVWLLPGADGRTKDMPF